MTLSKVAYGAGLLLAVGSAIGFIPVKPWLFVAGGLVAVGFFTSEN